MKKIFWILVIVMILSFGSTVFADNSFDDMDNIEGYESYDHFDGNSISPRWGGYDSTDWYIYRYPGSSWRELQTLENGSEFRSISQDFNLAIGDNYSSFYRFEIASSVNKLDQGNGRLSTVFYITNRGGDYLTAPIVFKQKYEDFQAKVGGEFQDLGDSGYTYYNLVTTIELQRIGDSNEFNVVIINSKDNSRQTYRSSVGTVTLSDEITVGLGSLESTKSEYVYFKAEAKDVEEKFANVYSLRQDGEQIEMSWGVDHPYRNVKVLFSETTDFTNATVLGTSGSWGRSEEFSLPASARKDGYIGVVPYKNSDEGLIKKYPFNYLEPVDTFGYVFLEERRYKSRGRWYTDNLYRYTWDAIDGANLYQTYYNGSPLYQVTNLTVDIPLSGSTSPTIVSINAFGDPMVGSYDSESSLFNALPGNLGAVKNLRVTENDDSAILRWDAYPNRTSYTVYRADGDGPFSAVSELRNITSTSATVNYSSINLASKYKVVAHIDDRESEYSNIVEVNNRVSNIQHTFDDTNNKVDLRWDHIKDAIVYNVYVSNTSSSKGALEDTITLSSVNSSLSKVDGEFGFSTSDSSDKYVTIDAIDPFGNSSTSRVYEIDFSRNNPVDLNDPVYVSNSGIVNLSWDELYGANAYKIYVGDSSNDLSYVETITGDTYDYVVKTDDPDRIYFAVQGIGASYDFVRSPAKNVRTFYNDLVENISFTVTIPESGGALQHSNTYVDLHWSDLNRAEKYIVEYDFDATIGDSTYTPVEVEDTYARINVGSLESNVVYLRVKGIYGSVPSKYSSTVNSNEVGKIDISVLDEVLLTEKKYNTPMEMVLEFRIGEDALYDSEIELDLKNILYNSKNYTLAKYIYPQIVSVSVGNYRTIGGKLVFDGSTIDHDVTISSGQKVNNVFNPDAGYKILVDITDANQHTKLVKDEILRVVLKTDLRFVTDMPSGREKESVTYINSTSSYALMDLPFFIANQITKVENEIRTKYGESHVVTDNTRIGVLMSYRTSNGNTTKFAKYFPVDYSFTNKNAILGE